MFRIDNNTAASSLPTPGAAGTPGYFTSGDLIEGISPTIPGADWANAIQEEFMSILAAADVAPSKTEFNQVLASISALFGVTVGTETSGAVTEYTIAVPGGYQIKLFIGPMPSGSNFNTATQDFLTPFPTACLWMGAGSSNAVSGDPTGNFHPVTIWFPISGWAKASFVVNVDTGQSVDSVASGLSYCGLAFGN